MRNRGKVYNSAAFITSAGDISGVYRKVHLREFEADWHSGVYTPGESFVVIDIEHEGEIYKVGLMICFDREIPESVRCLRSMGADLILCPLATDTFLLNGDGINKAINNEVLTRCRAVENEVFIAVINHALRFNGGSYVVDPLGNPIYSMGEEASVDVVSVPLSQASKMHTDALSWMGWAFRRPDVYNLYLSE